MSTAGQGRFTLKLHEDGRFDLGDRHGLYRIEGLTLRLVYDDAEVDYQFKLEGKRLTLSGGDLVRPAQFTKASRLGEPRDWMGDWSLTALKVKLRRIVAILLVVIISQLGLRLLRTAVHFIIYSDKGPLKIVYRHHKKRTMTMYALLLNVSRYVVYLLAIGFILTEFGVNYTVYFASLSVVGLAIGFGSQGLVQDMVTGFFIVFEEQFNVGDMVEIPPHTGIVEELGLRMTRLRNYLGQRIAIPNRNIAAVGNFVSGAQQVYLDIALACETDAEQVASVLMKVAEGVARQFPGVVLSAPRCEGEIPLAMGERFTRLHLSIWPQQQWIIDQELLPRIRAVMRAEKLEIAGDRIAVFYHPRESVALPRR
jgi:small conductance mechanosensitive channel